MNSEQILYRIGDWVVHVVYGLGQVTGKAKKILEGEKHTYLEVKTSDSFYWIPVVTIDNNRVRPLASKNQFKYALNIIQKPPMKMAKGYLQRKKDISQTLKNGSLYSRVRMIRDLHGRRATTKFNSNDYNVLINIKEQFLKEWTMVMDEDRNILETKLSEALKISLKNV
jgi:RNA polymerase-interacting CarD/CdnL/TRCF family regulator